ncbi:MAG: hypothetical protein ACOX45_10005 [Acutalibacteraceae bacterium]
MKKKVIVFIGFVLIVIFLFLYKSDSQIKITWYFSDKNINIYVPDRKSEVYIDDYNGFTDTSLIWIFNFNEKENSYILKNISENNKWIKMTDKDDENIIEYFPLLLSEPRMSDYKINIKESYYTIYCFYDQSGSESFITSDELEFDTNALILIYDSESRCYYAIRASK